MVESIFDKYRTGILHPFIECLLNLRQTDVLRWLWTDDGTGDAHFLKQSVVHDHFDASQCECFRYNHRRFMSFFPSSRMGELFGVIRAAGLSWNTWESREERSAYCSRDEYLSLEVLVPYAGWSAGSSRYDESGSYQCVL